VKELLGLDEQKKMDEEALHTPDRKQLFAFEHGRYQVGQMICRRGF
jgi:hypothetical protein